MPIDGITVKFDDDNLEKRLRNTNGEIHCKFYESKDFV